MKGMMIKWSLVFMEEKPAFTLGRMTRIEEFSQMNKIPQIIEFAELKLQVS